MTTSTALALPLTTEQMAELEHIVETSSLAVLEAAGQFEQAFRMASGIQAIDALITPDMMKPIMKLQNTALGFRTDKPQGYDVATVKQCLIEAVLRGLRPVGNEFNIISGRVYVTREGFMRLVKEYPDLTGLRLVPGVPRTMSGGALVDYHAAWTLNGERCTLDRAGDNAIPVRVNQGMGADAILGKAQRKMLKSVYETITGQDLPEGDVADVIDGEATPKKARRSALNDMIQEQEPVTAPAASNEDFEQAAHADAVKNGDLFDE